MFDFLYIERALYRINLTGVRAAMNNKLSRLDKSFAANVAFVWPFARVDSDVSMELSRVLESPSADVTRVRPLFGVNSPMDGQIFLD